MGVHSLGEKQGGGGCKKYVKQLLRALCGLWKGIRGTVLKLIGKNQDQDHELGQDPEDG